MARLFAIVPAFLISSLAIVLMLPDIFPPFYRAEGSRLTERPAQASASVGHVVPHPAEQAAAGSPVLSLPPDAALLGSGRVAFAWAGASVCRIQISRNTRFAPATIDAVSRTGSYKTRSALASGAYFWRVRAADKPGSGASWSSSRTFTVDAKAPVNTTAAAFINNGRKVATDARVTLTISATDKTGVTAYHVSERKQKPAKDDQGWVEVASTKTYAARVDYPLPGQGDGKKTVFVRFRDGAGNVSAPKNAAVILHTSQPETTITRRPANPTNSTSAAFAFVSDKRGATFLCSLDNGGYSACANNAASYEGLSAGPHTFSVKAIDGVGNAELTPASYAWTIDRTPPDTEITSMPGRTSLSGSAEFSFSSTKEASTFYCKLDGGEYGVCTSPRTYTALAEGAHAFFVRAVDAAGNADPTPANAAWTVAVFPVTITSQPLNPSDADSATFIFQSRMQGAALQCKLDDGAYTGCLSPLVVTGLAEGSHAFAVRVTADTGKEEAAPAQYAWVVNLPPLVKTHGRFINTTTGYVTDKNTVTLSLAAASEKGVAGYYASEHPEKPDPSDADWVPLKPVKEFSRDVKFAFSPNTGKRTVYVWFKDVEGNVSNAVSSSIYLYNSNYVLILFVLLQVAVIL